MAHKRKGCRAQMADWNYISREIKAAALASRRVPRCGCPANAPEADPDKYACPCGSHCKTCQPRPEAR